jgi:hypothetical protein
VDSRPITPEARAVGPAAGTPVALADGREWALADRLPYLGGVWDDLYDQNVLRGRYDGAKVKTAAYRLLRGNYDLTPDEAFGLLRDVEPAALVDAVERALFGPPPGRARQTWSDWVVASLLANGIDPDAVPAGRVEHVMDVLLATGRALPQERWISSQAAMIARRKMLDFGKD